MNRIQNIEGLENQVNLRSLDLSSNLIYDVENLESLGNLTQLYLQNNSITSIRNLNQSLRLQILNISMNMLQMIEDLDPLQGLSTLRRIELFGNPVCKVRGYGNYVTETLDFLQRIDNVDSMDFKKHALRILHPIMDELEGEYQRVVPLEPIKSNESKIREIHDKWLAGIQNESDDGYYE